MSDELQGAMIYTTTDSEQAALAGSMLKSANIEHIIKNEQSHVALEGSVIDTGGVEFWVPSKKSEAARRVLSNLDDFSNPDNFSESDT